MTDFKAGDVAMTRHGIGVVVQCRHEAHDRTPHWHYANGGWDELGYTANQARRIVVIDPEDREQVERLMAVYTGEAVKRGAISFAGYADKRADSMRAALREFATPTPPKPDEPAGLGAVVEDADGLKWVSVEEMPPFGRWYCGVLPEDDCSIADGAFREWSALSAVRVLSEGIQP